MDILTLLAVSAGLLYGYYGRPTADPILKWLKVGLIVSFACMAVFVLAGSVFGIIGLFLTTIVGGTVFTVLAASMVAWVILFLLSTAIGNQFREGMDERMLLFVLPLVAIAYFLNLPLTAMLVSLVAVAVFVVIGSQIYLNFGRKLEDAFTKKTAVTLMAAFACVLCVMWVGNYGIFGTFEAVPSTLVVSNIQVYNTQPVMPGDQLNVFVDLQNIGVATENQKVEVCVIPDKWMTSWGLTSVPFTSFSGTPGCCPANLFCYTLDVTLEANRAGGSIFTPTVPTTSAVDSCGSGGSAVDPNNKYWVVAGVIKSCYSPNVPNSGGYSSYKVTQLSVNSGSIRCYTDSGCGIATWAGSYYCSGTQIMRDRMTYTCLNPGTTASSCKETRVPTEVADCAMEGGLCMAGTDECAPTSCSLDSDCGTPNYVGPKFCSGNKVMQAWLTPKCNNPGTALSQCATASSANELTTCSTGTQCVSQNTSGHTIEATCVGSYCGNNQCDTALGESWTTCLNDCTPPWYIFGVGALLLVIPTLLYLQARAKK
jgi:hypothetical protein